MPAVDARHLRGVSETALLTLHQRATEAARPDGIIDDPVAIALHSALDYDYEHFGRTHQATAWRALIFDEATRAYLATRPRATVVALAEGLQTSFWRVDNGELTWISLDLEPVIALRRQLLPTPDRLGHLACSALDFSWMDRVDVTEGVLVTAEGLLQYLDRGSVFELIAACANRFPGGRLVFDSVPPMLSAYSRRRRGIKLSPHYTAPPMPFSFTAAQYDELLAVAGVRTVHELSPPPVRGALLRPATALWYRMPALARYRAAHTVVEFG
ncbi:class I SAM-dependent methyltransferase [Mycobacterium sp.]|uniref:class I SAM-dependent methyltransferase n=1 Tax=Mycobacterium sp. TaxID=1785 RepID=UPI003A87B643